MADILFISFQATNQSVPQNSHDFFCRPTVNEVPSFFAEWP